ncbi:2-methyl-6-phytyl-1,4-hydroquinone methyltransferase [Halomicronema hongdechloris C2206]|uniref:2-methyl-6-phytyl-1,4-hydroquinone methyltransferase n=1 Tax=Halomicronema hongdechloris C2206 TaxID=1641165 RepID=A0A1Z3HME8_9CYAN|nr:methyltransferase domain-containing protein [Halomicronema hongdechloris]ASC71481.1 2-methyl-6-phytyl-1,4-hydroquinone methyltransferase [Halomicronema hongdechloris C2206]
MATFLRPLSYRYQWLYDAISRTAALTVGGERRFRHLPLQGLTITPETRVLDLCCGSGQTTRFLVEQSEQVTGLDISPRSLERAQENVPQATYVQGWAEEMPLADNSFDVVHTSAAMHEMTPAQRQQIFQEAGRVLRPGGTLAMVDFHRPHNPLLWPGLALFLWLFETETAWQLLDSDVATELEKAGLQVTSFQLYGGGSLQVLHATKPASAPL